MYFRGGMISIYDDNSFELEITVRNVYCLLLILPEDQSEISMLNATLNAAKLTAKKFEMEDKLLPSTLQCSTEIIK